MRKLLGEAQGHLLPVTITGKIDCIWGKPTSFITNKNKYLISDLSRGKQKAKH